MKVTANIATYPPRIHSLKQCVASLYDHVDQIRISFNEWPEHLDMSYFVHLDKVHCIFPNNNLTDNGKFLALDMHKFITNEEYYLTCDDDLIYPPDYVKRTIQAIKSYGHIVTYHGRVLKGKNLDYYLGHKSWGCLKKVSKSIYIDVAGTGVTGFDTRIFHPKGLAHHKLKRMSDLIFSLEAAKAGVKIGLLEHDYGWLRAIEHEENIYDTESRNGNERQNEIANQIFELNHG